MTEEIGLTWLAEQCDDMEDLPPHELDCLIERGPVSAMVLVAGRSVTELRGASSLQLGRDVRRLRESDIPEEAIRTAWIASTDHAFDPFKEGVGVRTWLDMVEAAWLAEERRNSPGFVGPSADPVTDDASRAAVLHAVGTVGVDLALADMAGRMYDVLPVGDVVPALERVVTEVCADLGYRLFLRALKAYAVPVAPGARPALVALGERFGYPQGLVVQDLVQG
ncbi:hypothetical protein OG599_32445 [Streptomyces sp. NBC_01335]|uniref:hypothetical protein n=1 Tax=Streptomyces sp. NBC_01335 TaxID=2903828 RepID=UPI002E0EE39E|nr:hypothetical protein OG599_32445 [Streptomyces sp. NBC_01335]